MNKKKRCNKGGQITVFIILGLVILFAAIFMFQLAKKVQISELGEGRESVISKTFRKEGLRLYVEDCLNDELERGLKLIGNQSRIWSNQPGGRVDFTERLTGTIHPLSQERIFYGITQGTYFPDNAYPCKEGEPPDFCKYKYPNSSIVPGYPIKFGGRELDIGAIEGDLRRFLINRTIRCVENFTKTNISPAIKISTENLEMDLDILSDGIKVGVTYPLTLSLIGEEFFHLAEFDFFYVSDFKKLLDAAVLWPLKLEWSFVDFDYSKESLESDVFTSGKGRETEKDWRMRESEYKELAIKFESEEIAGADQVFKFRVPESKIFTQGSPDRDYIFQFARQNRPPALDYVERDYCDEDGYDYLVIEGDEEYGDINISLFAWDPDEDTDLDYSFEPDSPLINEREGNHFLDSSPPSGRYNISAIASDGHLSDWQSVRILVDREMKTDVSLSMPYEVYYGGTKYSYDDFSALSEGMTYWVSNEDPVFIKASWPGESLTKDVPTAITLQYTSDIESFGPYPLPDQLIITQSGSCFSLPWLKSKDCKIESNYNKDDLENWKIKLENPTSDFNHFKELTINGKLDLTFEITYCGKNEQSDTKEVRIEVRQCVPHDNPKHPYPYMPNNEHYKWEFGLDENRETDYEGGYTVIEDFNPFLATHECCDVNWEPKPEGTVCFRNPDPDCYGGVKYYALLGSAYGHYVLEQELGTCDGERGNICNVQEYGLWNKELRCGDNNLLGCNGIYSDCQNQLAWGYVDTNNDGTNDGWCHGTMGCQGVCKSPKAVIDVYEITGGRQFNINSHAKGSIKAVDDRSLGFECDYCSNYLDGTPCDNNFNGVFDKTCQGGSCI